ncbi:hypothetical protein GCM10017779_13260 [Streptomyces capillispiralis]|nr:hypothetical protein GCM10017779_13260 [Streptomyces capillispiralis]
MTEGSVDVLCIDCIGQLNDVVVRCGVDISPGDDSCREGNDVQVNGEFLIVVIAHCEVVALAVMTSLYEMKPAGMEAVCHVREPGFDQPDQMMPLSSYGTLLGLGRSARK